MFKMHWYHSLYKCNYANFSNYSQWINYPQELMFYVVEKKSIHLFHNPFLTYTILIIKKQSWF